MFAEAQEAARALLKDDPELEKLENHPLKVIIDRIFDQNKDGWN